MHKARLTGRRLKILQLIAKGYKNEQIAIEMKLTLCNTKFQKSRLYNFLCVRTQKDAVFVGLQMNLISFKELSKANKEMIRKLKEVNKWVNIPSF